ncbi:MAG: hypothetical protein AB7E95_03335 [Kiritimatiellales bacterium]
MKIKNPGNLVLAALTLITTSTGCTHQLKITNLNSYRSSARSADKSVKVCLSAGNYAGENILSGISGNLSRYNIQVSRASGANRDVDVNASVSISSEYKGSGWNFLINFPGFLVWAPAWHGYNYEIDHNITVHLSDARTGKPIDTINVPVVLNIRHADIRRTWTEISWLEFGIIAFVGGIVFINYDDGVTPLAAEKSGPVVTDYIAQKIAKSLVGIKNVSATQKVSEENFTATDFPIKSYQFDSVSQKGVVIVDVGEKGFQARNWVIKNIGMICSTKNVSLEAGNESFTGAKYKVLDEFIQDGLLTIKFEATY